MSKSSVKQRYIQLTEWLKTMDNPTRKTSKTTNNVPQQNPKKLVLDYNIRIKNFK